MIPKDFITEWRAHAPWVADRQVEQDLVISRALVELFSRKPIAEALALRHVSKRAPRRAHGCTTPLFSLFPVFE